MRRFQELKLLRSSNPLFALSWTVMHPIDEASPLYGLGLAEMIEHDMEIVVMLSGMDETIADRIYARHAYMAEEILWHRRFVDVVSVTPGGQRMVDLHRFHDTRGTQADSGRLHAAARNSVVAKRRSLPRHRRPRPRGVRQSRYAAASSAAARAPQQSSGRTGRAPRRPPDRRADRRSPDVGKSARLQAPAPALSRFRNEAKKERKRPREILPRSWPRRALPPGAGEALQRHLVAQRLVHFFLGLEVVVEGARGQRRGADDVAHRGGAKALFGKDLARRRPG